MLAPMIRPGFTRAVLLVGLVWLACPARALAGDRDVDGDAAAPASAGDRDVDGDAAAPASAGDRDGGGDAAAPASAGDRDGGGDAAAPTGGLAAAAPVVDDGSFAPDLLILGPAAPAALVRSVAGWDGARGAPIAEATAVVQLRGPLFVHGGAVYSSDDRQLGPVLGLDLRLPWNAVSATASLLYKVDGFFEDDGEVDGALSVAHRTGRLTLGGRAAVGSELDGVDYHAELALAALCALGSGVDVGLEARGRSGFGPGEAVHPPGYATRDLRAGPVATAALGRWALTVEGGASLADRRAGGYGLAGLGAVF